MTNTLKRVCIYPKDIQRITGKSYRQSTRLLKQIKAYYQKADDQILTIDEFCDFTGIHLDLVESFIY